MEFAYAGGGLGKGGKATLFVDGKKVGEGDIEATLAMVFSADDGWTWAKTAARPYPRTTVRRATPSTAG